MVEENGDVVDTQAADGLAVELPERMEQMAISVFDAAHGIPIRAQTVIALKSFGLSNRAIADRLGYKDTSGVRKILERYDPNRVAERGDAIRRLVLSCMFEALAFNILSNIKPEEISSLSVDKRIDLAIRAIKAINTLNAKRVTLEKREEELIKTLKEGIEDGERDEWHYGEPGGDGDAEAGGGDEYGDELGEDDGDGDEGGNDDD